RFRRCAGAWSTRTRAEKAPASCGSNALLGASLPCSHPRMDVRVAKCVLLTKVLAADGMITENERELLEEAMSRAGLSATERTTVTELEGWTEAASAVRKLSEEERRALMGELVEAASVDGRLSPLEAKALKQITADLDLG